MNVGKTEKIRLLVRDSGMMSTWQMTLKYKGKKKTRLPGKSLRRDGFF